MSENAVSLPSNQTGCCIVGAGPAGAMLAILLARQGVPVTLMESHMDFNREFRGDSIHPSVLNILDEIGLIDGLLQLPHTKLTLLEMQTRSGKLKFADYAWVKCKYPYEFLVAQSRFIDYITTQAARYPSFRLLMGAHVNDLILRDGVVRGVRYQGQAGQGEMEAALVVAADGRFSRLRKLAGMEAMETTSPLDILWFRLERKPDDPPEAFGQIGGGRILFVVDRDDYWQVGYVIRKGGYQELRAAGLDAFRQTIATLLPSLADRVDGLREWRQIATLEIASDRLRQWYKPGILFIGDAAHVMSPVGAVGINYAIHDAVIASNLLGPLLKQGKPITARDLAAVQRQREGPTKAVQNFQKFIQNRIYAPTIRGDGDFDFPPIARLIFRTPGLRARPVRLIAFGPRPVHVRGERPVN